MCGAGLGSLHTCLVVNDEESLQAALALYRKCTPTASTYSTFPVGPQALGAGRPGLLPSFGSYSLFAGCRGHATWQLRASP